MGWLEGMSELGIGSTTGSHHHHHSSKSRSKSVKHQSPRGSGIFGLGDSRSGKHHSSPRGSGIFGLGDSKSSKHHSSPRGSGIFGLGDHHGKHNSSRSSFFGFGDNYAKHSSSRSSFFARGCNGDRCNMVQWTAQRRRISLMDELRRTGTSHNHRSSSSAYRRSPRTGFMQRMYNKLRRLLRDLVYYMKRHPMKVFVLVILPLITGGALAALLAKFGIRMPAGLEKMFYQAGGSGSGVGVNHRGETQWERRRVEGNYPIGGGGGGAGGGGGGIGNALGGLGSILGGMGGVGGAVSLARLFMKGGDRGGKRAERNKDQRQGVFCKERANQQELGIGLDDRRSNMDVDPIWGFLRKASNGRGAGKGVI
ncbi:hypothetical protein MBM_04828 [Drepanopeziza brunnea f. sp. 'multigermtubi' MB_m1]|uniref:Uncharacterized protein n=1 Tax=Marssonina brunnea f. sp. multigermtubi (strain MB_m1) TaxID=1072389 RepID=K1WW49_MARBU|nr:uncharacterized protein MBM_04828 [Drepanopeziza brunnea f. sp. 'multigermtubi' MB_m1]EKD17251.1 hypothetical protein MBM_04828 [Drepanopeziza brunnea f. sp. 'multigermtubi' MB_m1]